MQGRVLVPIRSESFVGLNITHFIICYVGNLSKLLKYNYRCGVYRLLAPIRLHACVLILDNAHRFLGS